MNLRRVLQQKINIHELLCAGRIVAYTRVFAKTFWDLQHAS